MGRRLFDKVTVITGAASGIGRAAALRFADEEAGEKTTIDDQSRFEIA